MPCVEGELCHVFASSPKPTEAHGCQGGCGGRLHATCGSIADDDEMHRICSHCLLARGEKRKAVAPLKRKATEPPKGDGAEKSKARKAQKFLTFKQRVEVLDMLQTKVLSQKSIAASFGCSERTVRQVKADRVKIEEKASTAGAGGEKLSRPRNFPEEREAKISVTLDVIRSFGRSAKATLRATPTTSAAVRVKPDDKWANNFVKRSGLSSQRLNRVTHSRIDSGHCRESTDTGPGNLKVVPNECCLGRSPWTN